jgi:hypothetical protein
MADYIKRTIGIDEAALGGDMATQTQLTLPLTYTWYKL